MRTCEHANENPAGTDAVRPERVNASTSPAWIRTAHTRLAVLVMVVIPLLALFPGCEGPQGPPGEGVGDLDPQPPTVTLIEPARSDTIFASSFDIRASASDNVGVAYVDFYFDGSHEMGEQTARDSIAPYQWTWEFDSSGHDYGVYPLIARAVDLSNNVADSAPVLISYQALPEEEVLSYYGAGDQITYMTMPDKYGDRWFNVRFSPVAPCQLLEIQVELLEPVSNDVMFLPYGDDSEEPVLGPCDITFYAWTSGDDYMPDGAPLDSVFVAEADAQYSPDWTVADISGANLSFTGDFHAGFSVPNDQDYDQLIADQQAMAVLCHIDPNLYPGGQEHLHRSSEWDPDLGFGSMQEHWSTKLDFHIRAKVLYTDGTTAMLEPARGLPSRPADGQ